jgi:hypothetical protein
MTLASAVQAYVSRRKSEGSPFVSSESTLRSFGKWCGDIRLSDLTVNTIDGFLDSKRCTTGGGPNIVVTRGNLVAQSGGRWIPESQKFL